MIARLLTLLRRDLGLLLLGGRRGGATLPVLFFLAVAMIAGQHGEISKLKKRIEKLESPASGEAERQ